MAEHLCHAEGCNTPVPPRMFMCIDHWRRLPKRLKDLVWAHYVPGQEITKTPTAGYIEAAREAVEYIAEREGRRKPPSLF